MKLILLAIFVFILKVTAPAEDRLYITGYVRSFDKTTGILYIYVTTPGCEGLRQFLYPDNAKDDLELSLIGKRVDFFINVHSCERGKIYQMILK